MSFFNKLVGKIGRSGLAKEVYQSTFRISDNAIKELQKDDESPFKTINKNTLFYELFIVSLWALDFTLLDSKNRKSFFMEILKNCALDESFDDNLLSYERLQDRFEAYYDAWDESAGGMQAILGGIIAEKIFNTPQIDITIIGPLVAHVLSSLNMYSVLKDTYGI